MLEIQFDISILKDFSIGQKLDAKQCIGYTQMER